jgi:hypothetical protein
MPILNATKPIRSRPVDGSDVEVVVVSVDPDGPGISYGVVASERRDLQFFGGSYSY